LGCAHQPPNTRLRRMNERILLLAFLLGLVAWSCGRESEACSQSEAEHVFRIVASMSALAKPGVSDGSRIPCSDAACDGATWAEKAFEPRRNMRFSRWTFAGWTRRETQDEALDRWVSMASAIRRVAVASSEWWNGSPDQMAVLLVTVARHESAYWRSVQDGTIRGPAGEVCYLQLHPVVLRRMGIETGEVLGLDDDGTFGCMWHGAKMLAAARNACGGTGGHWSLGTLSRYGTGATCLNREAWVQARYRSYSHAAAANAHPERWASLRARVDKELGVYR
jgi:hypothetical protein